MLKFSVKADGFDALQENLAQACTKAEHIVATQVRKDTSPYVPFLTGSLDQRTMVDGNAIIYPGPYARFLYYGKVMRDAQGRAFYGSAPKHTTDEDLHYHGEPQRGKLWFERMKAAHKKSILKGCAKHFK